ncbi:hypothetical protein ACLGIX_13130 [Burkholderia vietnamiensis]|jgi:hypothetical protein|uniref:hypothetical protein n=1 Tax=Burkholderia TaxID=32008 RepID=UPI0007551401|nr:MULTISPECIES: hypothetical protein [Burkholderia]KVF39637.1 hypothetical protein WJ09_28425 [Burkholderia vietnamiensis]MBR8284925.1 hypothetical protein [Burkholderia vietnamiensis]NBJ22587.1 hypothetical protein [Burkholderia thailandensis]HEF4840710.1 hypothetical protein [Burkholderia vietnamiensis]
MENQVDDALKDEYLQAVKAKEQERWRTAVRSGGHTQEAMLFMAPSIVRNAVLRHRTDEF